jgi:hypothetical protein
MPRGGKRDGAGRPTGWSSGVQFKDTKLIRVPKHLAERLLDIAHRLDEGEDLDYLNDVLLKENKTLTEQVDLLILRNRYLCDQLNELRSCK